MMLPEHRKALAKHKKEAGEKHDTPYIDEHQFELWERLVQQSYEDGKQITVRALYRDKIRDITGVVLGFVLGEGLLRLSTDTGEKKVKISGIRSIE